MGMKLIIDVTTTYEGTAEEMRQRFPEEYETFMAHSPGADDRDWLRNCLAMGGPELFHKVRYEIDDWTEEEGSWL